MNAGDDEQMRAFGVTCDGVNFEIFIIDPGKQTLRI
jgi:hypothetical protein